MRRTSTRTVKIESLFSELPPPLRTKNCPSNKHRNVLSFFLFFFDLKWFRFAMKSMSDCQCTANEERGGEIDGRDETERSTDGMVVFDLEGDGEALSIAAGGGGESGSGTLKS